MQGLLIASLSLIGVLIGATLQYAYGQRLEAKKLLSNQKALAYTDYFKAAAGLSQGRTADLLALTADAKTRICLFGTPDVVRALKDLEEVGAILSEPKGQIAMAAIMNAMRADLLGTRSVPGTSDLSAVLFGMQ
ncbi:hypothetical protein [Lichenifustis flavocetrariae]|uniref:Uncharacterized protein n=1 Tax=Lichenifustis flavocetrariae TaxID=2949735 RepID=A0AA41YY66_9HYPH|nr:hypothetical protein [Lichenifustis flavocetrariae]MCW6510299.1 hypothetical protein [Lichenifustis flavocetrariae]